MSLNIVRATHDPWFLHYKYC